ncbi:hypothetical protein [Mesorhizobium sp. CAU 1732]|uniref:hypothetical protein n=1 Tax=Mesorhizobium sp. CAU 1732 TaxID=3140358 RepID=UPI00326072F3
MREMPFPSTAIIDQSPSRDQPDGLTVAPFDTADDVMIAALARHAASEVLALVGLLCFLIAIVAALVAFGDDPGIATALEAHR